MCIPIHMNDTQKKALEAPKHRKILSINTETVNLDGELKRMRTVVWCTRDSETSRSIRTTHFARTVYIGRAAWGVDARFPHKAVNLSKRDPLASIAKLTSKDRIDGSIRPYGAWFVADKQHEAKQDAVRQYFDGKSFKGTVRYTTTGETGGAIDSPIGCLHFYTCNAETGLSTGDSVEFTYHMRLGACYVKRAA